MALREKAGGDTNLFKVEKRLKRLQQKHQRQSERQYEREKQQTNVFDFINSKLGGKRGLYPAHSYRLRALQKVTLLLKWLLICIVS
jgi:hypothetical protein